MMCADAQPSQEAQHPNPLHYYLYWNRFGRRGQRCRIVEPGSISVRIEFEDGFQTIIDQRAIRRIPDEPAHEG